MYSLLYLASLAQHVFEIQSCCYIISCLLIFIVELYLTIEEHLVISSFGNYDMDRVLGSVETRLDLHFDAPTPGLNSTSEVP